MAGVDYGIISGAAGGRPVMLNDLATTYDQAAQIQNHREMAMQRQEAARQRQIMEEGYRQSVGEDGQIDQNRLMRYMAQNGGGAAVPGIMKHNAELTKIQAEVRNKNVDTSGKVQEILYKGLKETDGAIAALLANPQVDERTVYGEMGRLVNAGAFDVQAQHSGKSPDVYVKELLSTMPVGNPPALRNWLVQAGMRTADASKRLEMALPKYDEQDRGGVINQGTLNPLTGQRSEGTNVDKSLTPGEAAVSARAGEANRIAQQGVDVQREAAQTQIMETPQGFVGVNKGTLTARPVMLDNGQPVLSKDSSSAKNATMAKALSQMIPYARELLNAGPTGSSSGAAVDRILGATGNSTKGGNIAAQLDTVGGWFTSNVPRLEGPQGEKDMLLYAQMGGMVGDRTKPISDRLAALDSLEKLMEPYRGLPGTGPATMIAPRPPVPSRGPTAAAPRGSSPMRGGPAPAPAQGQPSIDSFFK